MRLRDLAFGILGALVAGALGVAYAEVSPNQVINTLTGTEYVEIISPVNTTAALAFAPVASLRDGRSYVYGTPSTGFTLTMGVNQSAVSLNPAGSLSTGAIVLPPTTFDAKIVSIFSTQAISTLTLSVSNGATINTPVTSLTANQSVEYVYDLATTTWYRIQ